MRKLVTLLLFVALMTALSLTPVTANAADTGTTAPQSGKIVSDEPGTNAPNILDGTVYSIVKVGSMIVVGGQFTQVQNYNTSLVLTRRNVFAFDAITGRISTAFAPDPGGTVYKVQAAADGRSVYVGGQFTSAAGRSMPSRLFKADVATGAVDASFAPPTISGDIRDLEVVGNRLWVAGKFTHLGGVAQKALGTLNASTGKYDSYFTGVMAGTHRSLTTNPSDLTNVLQISTNPANTRLMVVGNFTSVDGLARSQIAQFDISGAAYALSTWSTNLFTSSCSSKFETYMTDVEFSPNGQFFVVSTSGAWGGTSSATGSNGCDVVARFESNTTAGSVASWTAYTGGDTTWTVEVTDNVVYAGGHQSWQNNPIGSNVANQGAVSREGIAALNPVNGMPYSWNPTRARGVGVQDMLATSTGLYVGSDTTLMGHTAGNTYHARIAVLPLAGGATLPPLQSNTLPANVFRVATDASQLTSRSFTGTSATAAVDAPTGPGWATSTGAFMANGVLYKTNTDGSLSKMSFDGTTYGTASAVTTSDALVFQTDWHNDAKAITSLFYAEGRIYYTLSGQTGLYRRGFEVEDGVVGQQRFSTTTSGITWSSVRGAFVANGKLYYATTGGQLYSATWNQAAHAPVAGTIVQLTGAGTGWASRAMFPYQGAPGRTNEAPLAAATISCDKLVCSFDASGSSDPEAGPLSYDWDFGDGTPHGTGLTTTHTYADDGDRPVTLTVTDDRGATASTTRTASPTIVADSVSFVASSTTSGNRTNHTVTVPSGTQVGDTLLLFFASNSTGPVITGPAGWQQVLTENGSSFVGKLFTKQATASDLGTAATITSKNADNTAYYVRSDTTMTSYRGTGSPAISVSAMTSQNVATAVHQTPIVSAPDGKGWLVSYWSDKSSTTAATAWTGPATQTTRSQGTGTGTNHMSSLVMDSNGRVNTGGQGGLNATSETKAVGLTMSVLLTGGTPPPANQTPAAHASVVGCVQLTCSFDGGTSSDPDGEQLTYDWNWGDGTPHATTATASHTFTGGGDKTVTLTVTDPHGATSTDTVTATPSDPPPNTAPTARITSPSCTGLSCTVSGSTSSDPDSDTLTYDWDWDDNTAHGDTANPTHAYATAGARSVTLTVSDGHGHTASDTVTLNPTDTAQDPVSNITFVGAQSNAGNSMTRTVTLPAGVNVGDTMVLFLGASSIAPTYTAPDGWTLLESRNGSTSMAVRAWTRSATQADTLANAKVSVTSSTTAKADLSVAVYRGIDKAAPIASTASKIDNVAGAAHTSPAVTATTETSWLVTYWADRSNTTTAFTAPAGVTVRREGLPSDTGSAHAIGLVADSNGPVSAGTQGQLTAIANGDSSRGASVSVLLRSN